MLAQSARSAARSRSLTREAAKPLILLMLARLLARARCPLFFPPKGGKKRILVSIRMGGLVTPMTNAAKSEGCLVIFHDQSVTIDDLTGGDLTGGAPPKSWHRKPGNRAPRYQRKTCGILVMAKRGRKSHASLAATPIIPAALPPEPPYSLQDDEAAAIWRETLAALPDGYIPPEALPMLESFCRHLATARFISREIDRFKFDWLKNDGGVERLAKLTGIREREHRAMLAAARSLRLTTQSRMRPETAGRKIEGAAVGLPRPWDPVEPWDFNG